MKTAEMIADELVAKFEFQLSRSSSMSASDTYHLEAEIAKAVNKARADAYADAAETIFAEIRDRTPTAAVILLNMKAKKLRSEYGS